jgi:hypothetical protein
MHSRGFDLCRIQTNVVAPSANTPVAVDDYPGGARGPVLGAAALGVATYGVAKWREGYPGGTITPNSPGPGGSPMPGVAALGVATFGVAKLGEGYPGVASRGSQVASPRGPTCRLGFTTWLLEQCAPLQRFLHPG